MSSSSTLPTSHERLAAVLIGGGLALVLGAQWLDRLPLASAMALVAWGVLQLPRLKSQWQLSLVNLAIYTTLVGFAIASQMHGQQTATPSEVGLAVVADQALALSLMIALTVHCVQRIPSAH